MASRRHFIGTNGTEAGEMEAPIIPAADVEEGVVPVFETDEWAAVPLSTIRTIPQGEELLFEHGDGDVKIVHDGGDVLAIQRASDSEPANLNVGQISADGASFEGALGCDSLTVGADATLGTLTVGASATVGIDLTVGGDLNVTGGATIDGVTDLTGGFNAGANSQVDGDLAVTGAIKIGGDVAPPQLRGPDADTVSIRNNANDEYRDLALRTLTAAASVDAATFIDAGTEFRRNGTKILGAQGDAVADAAGGATIDAEARTAINLILARLRAHGLIAT